MLLLDLIFESNTFLPFNSRDGLKSDGGENG